MAFQIEAYEKENQECPFDDFLSDLSPKIKAKVLRDLDLLEVFGNRLREPYSKHLEDGIFELRTQLASDITRSLYFFYEGDRIIITHGFIKKTDENTTKGNSACKRISRRLDKEVWKMKYSELKEKHLQDPEVKQEYDALEPEYQFIHDLIVCREEMALSQQGLADLTGIDRADISRIENGNANPSLRTMKRIANGLGKRLEIRIV